MKHSALHCGRYLIGPICEVRGGLFFFFLPHNVIIIISFNFIVIIVVIIVIVIIIITIMAMIVDGERLQKMHVMVRSSFLRQLVSRKSRREIETFISLQGRVQRGPFSKYDQFPRILVTF